MLHCPKCGQDFAGAVEVCPEDGAALQADATVAIDLPSDPLVGMALDDKYRLDSCIGVGGMGTVYRATHLLIDRPVAVKVLNPRYVEDEAAQVRFRREARAAGRLQHTNAVTVTDFGTTPDGLVYLVMELLEGRTLRDILLREAPLDTARAVSMMLQASAAVGAAHDAGIIHRDLKPANIFIVQRKDAPPFVKVLDFGIAKLAAEAIDDDDPQTLTQVGAMIGTPRYMSPEQCEGAKLTPASDVYSLGIILYEMLTGTTPFSGTSPIAIAVKHAQAPPRRPREFVATIPAAIEELIMQALEKRPENRPEDANAFRRELHSVADRLGLEHAASLSAPTIDTLRSAGTETPSGRLVIDIERLRESRAAALAAQSVEATPPLEANSQNAGDGNAGDGHLAPAYPAVHYPAEIFAPVRPPAIARFRIFFGKKQGEARLLSRPLAILLISLIILVAAALTFAFILMRSPRKIIAANNIGEALTKLTLPGAVTGATPEAANEGGENGSQRQPSRKNTGPQRTAHTGQPKKPSTIKRIYNKAKKIIKNPF
ncbi:MAG TPA: protein kinase [Pyrinomonadaceae bacterium]